MRHWLLKGTAGALVALHLQAEDNSEAPASSSQLGLFSIDSALLNSWSLN